VFKECSLCKTRWTSRSKFLYDPEIRIIGYQVNITDIERGLILFNHLSCKNKLALDVDQLADMYKGPRYTENRRGSNECPNYCLNQNSLEPCPSKCSCSYVREVLQMIRNIDQVKMSLVS
jgi:hypothetical protein